MYNNNVIDDESFTVQSLIKYISENIVGLLLLLLAFVIIYVVDYVARINSLIFAMPSPIPGVTSAVNNVVMQKPNKTKKLKKR